MNEQSGILQDKRWKSADKDIFDNTEIKPNYARLDLHCLFSIKQLKQCKYHGKSKSHDGCDSCTCNAKFRERTDSEYQQRIEHNVYNDTGNLRPHGRNHISGGLQHFLYCDMNHVRYLHKCTDTHILNA